MSLLNNTLKVIKPPIEFQGERCRLEFQLGKSEKRVYFGLVHDYELKVWLLDESCCQMEWVLKHEADLTGWSSKHGIKQQQVHRRWTLHDINYHDRASRQNYNKKGDDIEAPLFLNEIVRNSLL